MDLMHLTQNVFKAKRGICVEQNNSSKCPNIQVPNIDTLDKLKCPCFLACYINIIQFQKFQFQF